MAYSFLAECKEQLISCKTYAELSAPQKTWIKIYRILEHAFSDGEKISKAFASLTPAVDYFRNSNKSLSDVYELFKLIQCLPWAVQKSFLKAEENSDIAEVLKGHTEKSLERLVFEERRATGKKLLKEVGFPEERLVEEYYAIKQEHQDILSKIAKVSSEIDKFRNLPIKKKMELKEKHREQLKEYDALEERRKELWKDIYGKDSRTYYLELQMKKMFSKIKTGLLQHSKISQKEADEWVDNNVNIKEADIENMLAETGQNAKEKITVQRVKKELANIYRITNGKLNKLNLVRGRLGSRSCCGGDRITWAEGDLEGLYHEAGHAFEHANQEHLAIAKRFIQDRATGKKVKLSTLTKDYRYEDCEKAYPDNFSHPYVGKIYNGATEVLSMGLQILGSEKSFVNGVKDIGHLEFCFGCFASEPVRVYNVEKDMTASVDPRRQKDWHEAIDNAMLPSFIKQLYGKGVKGYKIVENDYGDLELKHNRTGIYTCYNTKEIEEKDRVELARIAYLAICNYKGLVPEADPKLEKKYDGIKNLLLNVPKWFTPLTELPRL